MAEKRRPTDAKRAARRANLRAIARGAAKLEGGAGAGLPSIGEFAEDLIEEFGGTQAVARHIVAEFHAAKEGTQTRQRLLDTAVRLITAAGKAMAPPKELGELLDDEDVERELSERLERLDLDADSESEEADDGGKEEEQSDARADEGTP